MKVSSLSVSLFAVAALAAPAAGQTSKANSKEKSRLSALGSRIGDREKDPNGKRNGDLRTNRRIYNRMEMRLSGRIDRFDNSNTAYNSVRDPEFDNRIADGKSVGEDPTYGTGVADGTHVFGTGMPDPLPASAADTYDPYRTP